MRILKAIAKSLVAMTVMVAVWVESLARFVIRCLPGYQPPIPEQVVEEYVDAAEAAPVMPEADQRITNLQLVADALFRQQPIADAWLVGLSGRTLEWLEAQSADMLMVTARAKPSDLLAHIAGTKTIRGLLAYDPAAVEAYREAVARDAEPELERIRRRPRRQEPLLPAFGPIA